NPAGVADEAVFRWLRGEMACFAREKNAQLLISGQQGKSRFMGHGKLGKGFAMNIQGFRKSQGRSGPRIVFLMMAGFAFCAQRATRTRALRSFMFVLAAAVLGLCAWPAAAQSTTTYAYVGGPFSIPECQSGFWGFNCVN